MYKIRKKEILQTGVLVAGCPDLGPGLQMIHRDRTVALGRGCSVSGREVRRLIRENEFTITMSRQYKEMM